MTDRSRILTRAALASATRPLHLGVLGGGLVLGLTAAVSDWGGSTIGGALLFLGVAAYGALVALDLFNGDFVRSANEEPKRAYWSPQDFIAPGAIANPELRHVYQCIIREFQRAEGVLAGGGATLREQLGEGIARSSLLVVQAGRIAQRADGLHGYLVSDSESALEAEARRLEQLAESTRDEAAGASYRQAAEMKRKELETYRQVRTLSDRMHAQLKVIETSLDGIAAKMVKLRASDLDETLTVRETIRAHLDGVSTEVDILESTVEETMQEFMS